MSKAIANNKWQIRVKEVGGATFVVVGNVETMTPATSGDVQEYKTLDGGGATFREKTGYSFQIDVEGKVNTEDEGQILLLGKEFSNGSESKVEFEAQNTESGTIYSGQAIVDVTQGFGGSAEELSTFTVSLLGDGEMLRNLGNSDLGILLKAATCAEVSTYEITEVEATDVASIVAAMQPLVDQMVQLGCGGNTAISSDFNSVEISSTLVGGSAGESAHIHHIALDLNAETKEDITVLVTIVA